MLDMNKIITINRLSIWHINNYIKQNFTFLVDIRFSFGILILLVENKFYASDTTRKKNRFLSSLSIEFFFP